MTLTPARPGLLQLLFAVASLCLLGTVFIADLVTPSVGSLIWFFACVLIVAFVANARGDLLTPLNMAVGFFFVTYVIGSGAQVAAGKLYVDVFVIRAMGLGITGFLAFWVGYALPAGGSSPRLPSRFTMPVQRGRLTVASLVVLMVSAACLLVYLNLVGASYFSPSLYGEHIELMRGRYSLAWGATFSTALPLLWYSHGRTSGNGGSRVIVALLLVAAVILTFPLGVRTPMVYPFLSLLVCRNYLRKPIHLHAILGWGLVLAVLAVVYQLHRYSTLGVLSVEDIPRILRDPDLLSQYMSAEWMVLGDLALAVSIWPRFRPFMLGKSYLMVLVTPIPRILWPSKPFLEVSYLMNVEIFGYDRAALVGGQAVGTVGESYVNFGVAGAIAVPLVLGLVCRRVYEFAARNRESPLVPPLYATFLYGLFIALRGELPAGVIQIIQFTIPLALIYLWASPVSGVRESSIPSRAPLSQDPT